MKDTVTTAPTKAKAKAAQKKAAPPKRAVQKQAAEPSKATKDHSFARVSNKARAGTVHPKLRQRAAEVRRRPWRLVGIIALVAALVGGVIYLFGFSNAFVVEEVTVTGADGEVADGAREVAVQTMAHPMARVNTARLEEQVLQDLRIETADISRAWPSTLTLDLTLRTPALVVNQSGVQGLQLVDAEGVIYDTVADRPEDIPFVRAPKGELDPAQLRAVQAVPAALPDSVAERADGLRLRDGGKITFSVGDIEVIWGDGSNAELKGRVLEGLLAQDGFAAALGEDASASDGDGSGEDGSGEDGSGEDGQDSGEAADAAAVDSAPEGELTATGEPLVIDLSTPATPVVTGLQTAEPTD